MRNRRFVRSCNDGDCDVVTTSTCEARPGFVCPVAGTMWGRVSCALRRGCSPTSTPLVQSQWGYHCANLVEPVGQPIRQWKVG